MTLTENLTKLVQNLQAFRLWTHAAHHASKGAAFEGDHETYATIYATANDEFDAAVEKAVGLTGDESLADPGDLATAAAEILGDYDSPSGESAEDIAETAARFNDAILELVNEVNGDLAESGALTPGLANFLGGVADTHETFAYLLGQRTADDDTDDDDAADAEEVEKAFRAHTDAIFKGGALSSLFANRPAPRPVWG